MADQNDYTPGGGKILNSLNRVRYVGDHLDEASKGFKTSPVSDGNSNLIFGNYPKNFEFI